MPVDTGLWTDQDSPSITLDANGSDTALNLVFTDNGNFTGQLAALPQKRVTKLIFEQGQSLVSGNGLFSGWSYKTAGDPNWQLPPTDSVLTADPDTVAYRYIETDPDNFNDQDLNSYGSTLSILNSQPVRAIVTLASPIEITEIRYTPWAGGGTNTYDMLNVIVEYEDTSTETVINAGQVSNVNGDIDASSVFGTIVQNPIFPDTGTVTITGTDPDGLTDTQLIVIDIKDPVRITQIELGTLAILPGPFDATKLIADSLEGWGGPLQGTKFMADSLERYTTEFQVTSIFSDALEAVSAGAAITSMYVDILETI